MIRFPIIEAIVNFCNKHFYFWILIPPKGYKPTRLMFIIGLFLSLIALTIGLITLLYTITNNSTISLLAVGILYILISLSIGQNSKSLTKVEYEKWWKAEISIWKRTNND